MQTKTILLNGVSGSGKSTIIKALVGEPHKQMLDIISPANYQKGTTSTNVKYTFGRFEDLSIEHAVINDFSEEWSDYRVQREKECRDKQVEYNEAQEEVRYFSKINTKFSDKKYLDNVSIDFGNECSRNQLAETIKHMCIADVLKLINQNNIDEYILGIEINIPLLNDLEPILHKHNITRLSIVDTKGLGQDQRSRHLDFSEIDCVLFINDGSKITDIYQNEIKDDFKQFLKSTPILLALRHNFDLVFENLSGFNNSLLTSTPVEDYINALNVYCSNTSSNTYNQIKTILETCGLYNSGFLNKIISKYAFNAIPYDYSKDDSMPPIYCEKTQKFYIAAVLNMVDRCLESIDEYIGAYNAAATILQQQGQYINSAFVDISTIGVELIKQIDKENRLTAKILRSYPDSWQTKYSWINSALNNDNYEEKRLRVTLYNMVDVAIDEVIEQLVQSGSMAKEDGEILSVYFSIQLKSNSEKVTTLNRLGVKKSAKIVAINYLVNNMEKKYKRLQWYYKPINLINSTDRCKASTLIELYIGLFTSLNLVNFDSDLLLKAMVENE